MAKAVFNEFKVEAEYVGKKAAKWTVRGKENYNHHVITVTNTENGKWAQFDFWNGIESGKLETEYDILNAFYCFVLDAISGDMAFDEFCGEFGYETVKEAMSVHRDCISALESLKDIYYGDIYDLANELGDAYA